MKPSQRISPKFDMKVLLVDDDEDFANGLKIFLEKFNIATVIESRITSAEKQLKKFEFDIILLDVIKLAKNVDGLYIYPVPTHVLLPRPNIGYDYRMTTLCGDFDYI